MRKYAMGFLQGGVGAQRRFKLHHDQVVLLQMQLAVGHDDDLCRITPFEIFQTLLLLFLKQSRNGRMGSHDNALLFR